MNHVNNQQFDVFQIWLIVSDHKYFNMMYKTKKTFPASAVNNIKDMFDLFRRQIFWYVK